MNEQDRQEELNSKETLTDAEMQELVRLSPPGRFKKFPANVFDLGITNLEKAFENLKKGPERTKHALKNGCYLEVISLRLQHAEFWLRMYWVVKNKGGKIFDPEDKRTFGVIIEDCGKLGFRTDLIERLKEFNLHRINAIHKYLQGATSYEELRNVCETTTGLDGEVGEYVRNEVGIPKN
jgi:hypothetical protein